MGKKFFKKKILGIIAIVVAIITAIITIVYSDNSNHFVVDVVQDVGISDYDDGVTIEKLDDNLTVTETIIPKSITGGVKDFDSKELNYQVEISNKIGKNMETQVAMVIDTSYSMDENAKIDEVKAEAQALANGIISSGYRLSVSDNNNVLTKNGSQNTVNAVNSTLTNAFSNLVYGKYQDCNQGLENAYNNGFDAPSSGKTLNKIILYFTDSTDKVSDKLIDIINRTENIKIITILVDLTSDSYYSDLENGIPIANDTERHNVYVWTKNIEETDLITKNANIYTRQKIYDDVNSVAQNIVVENIFSDTIKNYFEIENLKVIPNVKNGTENVEYKYNTDGEIIGYVWNVEKLITNNSAKISFTLKFNNEKEISAVSIFEDTQTNKKQLVTYNKYNSKEEDKVRFDTAEAIQKTTIKICEGYDLKIKAVNESNNDLSVPGVNFRIKAEKEETGEVILDKEYTVDSNGSITITPKDARSLRSNGKIIYTVTPINTGAIIGYDDTDPVMFAVDNSKVRKWLEVDDYGNLEIEEPNQTLRLVTVKIPINTTKFDIKVNVQELNNSNVILPGCKFELIQPMLNNSFKMERLEGTTDANGQIVFPATVMTQNGKYIYYLRQITVPQDYNLANVAVMTVEFKDGRVFVDSTRKINVTNSENVEAELTYDSTLATTNKDTIQVFVANECIADNPFDIQINLKDADNDTKVEGAKYKITTTPISTGIPRVDAGNITDVNGQINTNILGGGYLQIEIIEESPAPGYQEDKTPKIITVNRQDGKLVMKLDDSIDTYGNKLYSTDFLLDGEGNPVGLKVDLTSKKKKIQNVVKLKLVDAEEHDVSIGQNVIYDLYDDEGNNYGPALSNSLGEIQFTVRNRPAGTYTYTLKPNLSTIPSDYDSSRVSREIKINLEFGNDENIINGSLQEADTTVIDENTIQKTDEKDIYKGYELTIEYYQFYGETFSFTVQLSEEANPTKKLSGAKYNIIIYYDVEQSGQTVTKQKLIPGRQTGVNGTISTLIPKSREVTILLQEIQSIAGYFLDDTPQTIVLGQDNQGEMKLISETPYVYSTSTPNNGTVENTDKTGFTYYHYNRKRTTDDLYLNLTINKFDLSGNRVDGVLVNVSSPNMTTFEGNSEVILNKTIATGYQAEARGSTEVTGEVVYDYGDYKTNQPYSYTIKIPRISEKEQNEKGEYVVNFYIYEMNEDGTKKENTKVSVRLIYKIEDGIVTLTNCESYEGNRLVRYKNYSGSREYDPEMLASLKESEENYGIYLSHVILDLYTNYEDVGNMSLDFKKLNVNGEFLNGAKYEVTVDRLKKQFVINNEDDSDAIELKALSVKEGSIITLKEKEAPIGYARNYYDETYEVKSINDFGEIVLEKADESYDPPRTKPIVAKETTLSSDGTVKNNFELSLIDYQLDTFRIGVDTKDSETRNDVPGFEFEIQSSKGAQNKVSSGNSTNVGGNLADTEIYYTLTSKKTAKYYKDFTHQIQLKVIFDESGNVKQQETKDSQVDPNYGVLWEIGHIESTSVGNIRLTIYVKHQDPLKVKIETYDSFKEQPITNAAYSVTPSYQISGIGDIGQSSIDVGYVTQNDTVTYTLKQTSIPTNYVLADDVKFTVEYENEKVKGTPQISQTNLINKKASIQKTGDQEVTIKFYNDPKIPFEITNIEYFTPNNPIQGSSFVIHDVYSNSVVTGNTTDQYGKTELFVSKMQKGIEKVFRIEQSTSGTNYGTVEDFYVKVWYDANGNIQDAKIVDDLEREVTDNIFVTLTYDAGTATTIGKIKLTVKNYPEFKMNLINVDRRDGTTPINGTKYTVTSTYVETVDSNNITQNFMSDSNIETITNGTGVAHLNRTKLNKTVIYTISENIPGVGYQTLGTAIRIRVQFDSNGLMIGTPELVDNAQNKIAQVTLNPIVTDEDKFEFNVIIKNNPVLLFNIVSQDSEDPDEKLADVGLQMISTIGSTKYSDSSDTTKVNLTGTPITSYSNTDGLAKIYMDRTEDSQDMIYTIKTIKKPVGYNWLDDEIAIKVTFDENGKIQTTPAINKGNSSVYSIDYDAENFVVNVNIKWVQIDEFGIHLIAQDKYDSDKKLNNLKVEAFMTQEGTYNSDGIHEFLGNNSLITGNDRNNDGYADQGVGEDFATMGKYETHAAEGTITETRQMRLRILNDVKATENSLQYKPTDPNGYYLDTADGSNSGKTLGFYKGSTYYEDAWYEATGFEYLIEVTFDDVGKVVAARVVGDQMRNSNGYYDPDPTLGYLANSNYIEVIPKGYTIEVKLKLYPLIKVDAQAIDNWVTENIEGVDYSKKLNGSRYRFSTIHHNSEIDTSDYITDGYIGWGDLRDYRVKVYDWPRSFGYLYEATGELFFRAEANKQRKIYIFEEQEPTNYQKHGDREGTEAGKLIGAITFSYNEKGEIDYTHSIDEYVKDGSGNYTGVVRPVFKPYLTIRPIPILGNGYVEDYCAKDNLKEYKYEYTTVQANNATTISIGYALTTKVNLTAVDEISGDPISNIKIFPFMNNNWKTNMPYEPLGQYQEKIISEPNPGNPSSIITRTTYYKNTDNAGNVKFAYWGSAIPSSQDLYMINSEATGNSYNGYFFPADMTSAAIGGSGNIYDKSNYYAKLDVTYDDKGKISEVKPLGTNLWGDKNAEVTWDSETGTINVRLLFSRKFQTKLEKVDYYDNTIKLDANFDIVSNKGLNARISSSQNMVPLGKAYANETVKYTLSETTVPNGYFPISGTIDYYVTFDSNGNVNTSSVSSSSEYFGDVTTSRNN